MAALLGPLLLAPATNAPHRRRAQVASGWLVLPLLLSLGSARGGGKLQLRGDDAGQIEFEPTGAAKLIGDEHSINTTVGFGVGGELIVGDQAASGAASLNISGCTLSSEGLAITADCPLRDTETTANVSALQAQVANLTAQVAEVEALRQQVSILSRVYKQTRSFIVHDGSANRKRLRLGDFVSNAGSGHQWMEITIIGSHRGGFSCAHANSVKECERAYYRKSKRSSRACKLGLKPTRPSVCSSPVPLPSLPKLCVFGMRSDHLCWRLHELVRSRRSVLGRG